MSLWTWSELVQAVSQPPARLLAREGQEVSEIDYLSIDSRSIRPGEMFIALDGGLQGLGSSSRDGHDFVESAAKRGAAAALVHRDDNYSLPVLRVNDTFDGLKALARQAVRRCPAKRVAVTGSSGKTTLRTFIETVTRDQLRTHASVGSFNNHLGVPLSLARMPKDTELATFEVGMNQPGEIAPLTRLIAPDVAVVLNVASVHIGNFASMDALRNEKLSIREGLQSGGTLILPDDIESEESDQRLLRFGLSAAADVQATRIDGTHVSAKVLGEQVDYRLPAPGRHLLLTSLATLGVAAVLGLDLRQAAESIQKVALPVGRGSRVKVGGITVVDESYNANPLSTRIALETLSNSRARRKLAIIGEMLELGDSGPEFHRQLAVACDGIDQVFTVGSLALELYRSLPKERCWRHVNSYDELVVDWLVTELRPGDELLIKGSNKVFWTRKVVPRLLEALAQTSSARP